MGLFTKVSAFVDLFTAQVSAYKWIILNQNQGTHLTSNYNTSYLRNESLRRNKYFSDEITSEYLYMLIWKFTMEE